MTTANRFAVLSVDDIQEPSATVMAESRSPISWIPNEILILIFLAISDDPLHLTWVCQHWRSLAQNVPHLWTQTRTAWPIEALDVILSRSRALPLDVNIDATSTTLLRTAFSDQLARVRSLSTVLRSESRVEIQKLVTFIATQNFAVLEDLSINVQTSHTNLLQVIPARGHSDAKVRCALRALSLVNLPCEYIPENMLQNLTLLNISYPHAEEGQALKLCDLVNMLALTPMLDTLIITNTPVDGSEAVPSSRIVNLKHLTALQWDGCPDTLFSVFLRNVTLPALTLLEFDLRTVPAHLQYYAEPAPVTALATTTLLSLKANQLFRTARILRRFEFPVLESLELTNTELKMPVLPKMETLFRTPSMLRLTHLIVTAFTFESEDVLEMLGYMPALVSLWVDACAGLPALLQALAHGRCPVLEELEFWECDDLSGSDILDVAQRSPWPEDGRYIKNLPKRGRKQDEMHGVRLKRVKIDSCRCVDEEEVEELRDGGVEVDYRQYVDNDLDD
ncbi:hypothetical protein CYLTODRAFT_447567 [Cylindrobasidium torrendii FP15055 ss-10]|uniref:Uncharacterized protein n=1 Tax=Cylindrobasidium torrendii FP15055 ss-10 TaxID=1314674 RepID=A0A0D7AWU8_9AGAR|nr:hypothetical protein CYLTODRAFT_447567 [Cylindrobasidium torrendii FP15055 ss-10]